MPESHDEHIDKKSCTGCIQPGFKPLFPDRLNHKPGKKKVPEPVRQGDVPTIPKFLNINA